MISYNLIFIYFSFSCIAALYLGNIFHNSTLLLFLIMGFSLLLLNFYAWTRKYVPYLLGVLGGLLLSLGIHYFFIQSWENKEEIISSYDTTLEYSIDFEIQSLYKKDDFDVSYIGKIQSIDGNKIGEKIHILFRTKSNFDLKRGDIIGLDTVITSVKNYNNDFDYVSFLQSKNVYLNIYSHNFENKGSAELSWYRQKISALREKTMILIYELYPEKEAVFLGGILIGARESIPDDMSEDFNNSGLTHLIAVSGYNITIIIVFLSYILSYFPVYFRVVCITFCIVSYASIVGDSAAVIRASLMGLVGYYVLMSGRKGDSLAIILLTALLMLMYNPLLINHDISFQLSFLAVFGLLYTQGFFEKIFFFIPKKYALQESFVLTLSAFVFTLPIMLYSFDQVSVLAPIANMLVGWSIPFAMFFGVVSLLLYALNPTIGFIVGYIEYFFLKWTNIVAHFFGNLEFSRFRWDMGDNGLHFVSIYFLVVIFSILYFKKPA